MQDLNTSRFNGNSEAPLETSDYRRCTEAARPRLADEASGTRLLLIVPKDADVTALRRSLTTDDGQHATIVHSNGGDFIACQEAELLEVRSVAARLVDNRRDFAEIAKRLHTRIDVDWDDMFASTPQAPLLPPDHRPDSCTVSEVSP